MKKNATNPKASSAIYFQNHNATQNQEITEVLYFIPASVPRDQWAQVAMALKYAGLDFEVFDTWSSTGNNYDAKAARDTWKSISHDGGISIKTLFHIAKQYGYDPRQSKADFKPLIEQAEQRQAKAGKARQMAADKASERAESILDACTYAPSNHPYLLAKKITPSTPIWLHKTALTVPVMDLLGNVHSLQFIQPDGKKLFLKNGAIGGHFYQLWSRKKPSDAVVICEGYATGCTLTEHYTPDCSVVVAFNSNNLQPVAKVFRAAFPDARILIAGDADEAGRKAAFNAAGAVRADVVLPNFLEGEAGTDWNDRWCLDEVRA